MCQEPIMHGNSGVTRSWGPSCGVVLSLRSCQSDRNYEELKSTNQALNSFPP